MPDTAENREDVELIAGNEEVKFVQRKKDTRLRTKVPEAGRRKAREVKQEEICEQDAPQSIEYKKKVNAQRARVVEGLNRLDAGEDLATVLDGVRGSKGKESSSESSHAERGGMFLRLRRKSLGVIEEEPEQV